MYRKSRHNEELPEIGLYFEGRLSPENRWVKMAELVPWNELEMNYAKHFQSHGCGEIALNVQFALGALLIKEILQSDRDVVEMVCENPYLQYFLGLKSFQTEPPFSASLMTHFRKRLPKDVVISFNEKVIGQAKKDSSPDDDPPENGGGSPPSDSSSSSEETNSRAILMDATCVPADIKYPTDLNLVNDAREFAEEIIDRLREQCSDTNPRPRTKREICRKRYLEIIKHPKCGIFKRREALRFLLNAIRRNLEFIAGLREQCDTLPEAILEQLTIIQTIHGQERTVLNTRSRRIDNRIVSFNQPHVRPIVRGRENLLFFPDQCK